MRLGGACHPLDPTAVCGSTLAFSERESQVSVFVGLLSGTIVSWEKNLSISLKGLSQLLAFLQLS